MAVSVFLVSMCLPPVVATAWVQGQRAVQGTYAQSVCKVFLCNDFA
jgi:hypothetical protein